MVTPKCGIVKSFATQSRLCCELRILKVVDVEPLEVAVLCEVCLWPVLTPIKSVMNPGRDIWMSLMSISSLIILIAVDICGRSTGVSCTQSSPTFKNRTASSSGKSPFNVGSISSKSLLALYISHACTYDHKITR